MEEVDCCKAEKAKEDEKIKTTAATDDDGGDDEKSVAVHSNLRRLSGPTRRSSKANWTEEEDGILRDAVQKYEGKSWKKIAGCLPGRTDVQCLHRWQKVLNPDLVKGPWTKEEDSLLFDLVGRSGEKKWSEIAEQLPGRMGKQCRERWYNHLKPEINKAAWTDEEEKILINAHAEYGNKWSVLAKLLPGRTENSVKNHWNCSLKKKLSHCSVVNRPKQTIPPMQDNHQERPQEFVDEGENPSCSALLEASPGGSNEDLIRPRRNSEGSYTGLCYEPIPSLDLSVLLSSGGFSRCGMNGLCDSYSRIRSILRSAALSYGNMPSIIRKSAFKLLQKGVSAPENDGGGLNGGAEGNVEK